MGSFIEINLYRLIQEGLNNVRKHAAAGRTMIKLVGSHPDIILRLIDDGGGFDMKARQRALGAERRLGLRSMKERVSLLQGRMEPRSPLGKGTRSTSNFLFRRKKLSRKNRVLIVDDHPLFREGLKSIIASSRQYEVVGEAGTRQEAIERVRQLSPDLILLDVSLPDGSGLELIGDLMKCSKKSRILIVSMHAKIDYIVKAFQAGATGYLAKGSAAEKLLQGMEHVLKGDYFMDTSVSQQVVKKLVGLAPKEALTTGSSYDTLTAREQEVMVLLAEGLSVIQAAEKLFISPKTVENHRSNIMRKLGIHKTIDLVRYAARLGLIDIDLWKE